MKLVLLIIYLFSPFLMAECEIDRNFINAKYSIRNMQSDSSSYSKKLNFWRMSDQVAYQHLDNKVTEIWNQITNGQIRPIRYFEQYQRGIEYQPTDINAGKGENNWAAKYQMIDPNFFEKLNLLSTRENGCNTSIHYQSKIKDKASDETKKINLVWLSHYQLPQKLSVQVGESLLIWELQELIFDKEQVISFFKNRDRYQLTDYADVGDNESDPFLIKMVNLGFVSHSLSNSYSSIVKNQRSNEGNYHGHSH